MKFMRVMQPKGGRGVLSAFEGKISPFPKPEGLKPVLGPRCMMPNNYLGTKRA